jgi:hypothetical protein
VKLRHEHVVFSVHINLTELSLLLKENHEHSFIQKMLKENNEHSFTQKFFSAQWIQSAPYFYLNQLEPTWPTWTNLNLLEQSWTKLNQVNPSCTKLNQLEATWTYLNLPVLEQSWTKWIQVEPSCTKLNQPEPNRAEIKTKSQTRKKSKNI